MDRLIVVTDSYFDGHTYQHNGPYKLLIESGAITSIEPYTEASSVDKGIPYYKAPFLMPGLVEAHCHLFLDGGELDFKARSEYLKASPEEMMAVARKNVQTSLDRGITLIRDAGDKYNINHSIKEEVVNHEGCRPDIRSPGLGIRRPKRYGSFMASEAETPDDIIRTIENLAETSDDLKVILTGIIDFEAGSVKGDPQFDLESLKLIVETAHNNQLLTFAHCSGLAGLKLAVDAGVDSIEHGFFMNRNILERMAEKNIAWVPTFSPVHFQWARPELADWNDQTIDNLFTIVEAHKTAIALADESGVPIVAGSDAGSHGVPHGDALINELFFLIESGLPVDAALRAATSTPRKLWGVPSADLVTGNQANFVALAGDPFKDADQLWHVRAVYKDRLYSVNDAETDQNTAIPHSWRTG